MLTKRSIYNKYLKENGYSYRRELAYFSDDSIDISLYNRGPITGYEFGFNKRGISDLEIYWETKSEQLLFWITGYGRLTEGDAPSLLNIKEYLFYLKIKKFIEKMPKVK